jgi:hypothetical protein
MRDALGHLEGKQLQRYDYVKERAHSVLLRRSITTILSYLICIKLFERLSILLNAINFVYLPPSQDRFV